MFDLNRWLPAFTIYNSDHTVATRVHASCPAAALRKAAIDRSYVSIVDVDNVALYLKEEDAFVVIERGAGKPETIGATVAKLLLLASQPDCPTTKSLSHLKPRKRQGDYSSNDEFGGTFPVCSTPWDIIL